MKNWHFFLLAFGVAALIYGILSISRFFWKGTNPMDLSPAQISLITGTASAKDKLLIFLMQFIGAIFHIWLYVIAGIATLIYSFLK